MRHSRAGVLAALFLAALALRPQIVGAGPLFPEIQDDLDTSHAVVGLLATIPVLCMGLFAPPARRLVARVGTRSAIAFCLLLIAGFGIARALAPQAAAVVVLTFGVGAGMGLAGALLPVAVKERFADRPAFATGVYATGIQLGSALSSAVAVPVAVAFGGWRASLLAFSLATAGLLVAWLVLTRGAPAHSIDPEPRSPLPWRSGTAWLLVALFGLMGLTYYGINAWLPDSYVERGWSETSAGALLAVLNLAALPSSFLLPWASDRHGGRRRFLTAMGVLLVVGLCGLVLTPEAGYLWAACVGVANGAMFPLVLTLPLDVADRARDVAALVGMMLGVGYVIAATSPFTLGAVRDLTGSFTGALWALVAAGAAWLGCTLALSRERLAAAPARS
jgi:CP family cyanate transporter-like MFS transporter